MFMLFRLSSSSTAIGTPGNGSGGGGGGGSGSGGGGNSGGGGGGTAGNGTSGGDFLRRSHPLAEHTALHPAYRINYMDHLYHQLQASTHSPNTSLHGNYPYIHTNRSVLANGAQELSVTTSSSTNNESEGFVKGTRISAGSFSSSVQKRLEPDSSLCCSSNAFYFPLRAMTEMGVYFVDSANPSLYFMRILYSSFLFSFSGLGGLGPEYLLHAAGPASTLASSEFPFSIDGKSNNMYPLFNVHADVCTCD